MGARTLASEPTWQTSALSPFHLSLSYFLSPCPLAPPPPPRLFLLLLLLSLSSSTAAGVWLTIWCISATFLYFLDVFLVSAEVWACQMVQLDLGTCLGPCPGYQWPRALVFGSIAFGFFPFGFPGVMRSSASVCLLSVGLVKRRLWVLPGISSSSFWTELVFFISHSTLFAS